MWKRGRKVVALCVPGGVFSLSWGVFWRVFLFLFFFFLGFSFLLEAFGLLFFFLGGRRRWTCGQVSGDGRT